MIKEVFVDGALPLLYRLPCKHAALMHPAVSVAGTLDGVALPSNVFWAGAINPGNMAAHLAKAFAPRESGGVAERKELEAPAEAARQDIVDYTGVRAMADTADFVVREMPLALQVQHIVTWR